VVTAEELRRQSVLERRFRAMGLEAGLLPGGRAVVATLPLGPAPFETPDGPHVLRAVRFYTVGHDRIKCVAPRALFHLPLIRVVDCTRPAEIEARIRAAWKQRLEMLRDARDWLDSTGVEVDPTQGAPLWSFGLGLEDPRARAVVIERGRIVLPSRGPLSGLVLDSGEERVFQPDATCQTATDLEIATTVRLEVLARRKRAAASRRVNDAELLPAPRAARALQLLLVGSRLAQANALHESLRLRGFDAQVVTTASAALDAFRSRSFDLVLAETRLDRSDGIELVPALRGMPGILDLPVVLLDERPSEQRREASRAAGASGYLAGGPDAARVAGALAQMASQRRRRRFVRYSRALSVSWPGCDAPAVTAEVGRGGCRLLGPVPTPDRGRFALHLPETGRTLRVDAAVLYRLGEETPWPTHAVGLRFTGFEADAEPAWIDYLARIELARDEMGRTGSAPLATTLNAREQADA
jgi:two-component system chemotaxis response regulator CheY